MSRADWIDAAIALLVEDGIDAVQITALARALSITRGSFYWHFGSRDALLDAVLEEWRRRNTGVMLAALQDAQTLDDGLLALFQVWVDKEEFDPLLDQSVREWARRSAPLCQRVQVEDDSRVAAIAGFLQSHGFDETEAFIRARVIYFTQLSYHALGVDEPMAARLSYLDAYFKCFIGRPPAAKAAEDFTRMFLQDTRRTVNG